ncbi:Geminin [Eumeta japonica]|uniref:Geminin n=1 Tax=Eumeta variegata TaxID=151549 RepID=A0A4C1XGJ4_EUMVA|nr:Geminin [Eumeta japonica]
MSLEKDSLKGGRKTLKTLQHTAVENENLVGRGAKNLKHQLSPPPVDVEAKRKNLNHKETQADFINKVTEQDLTNPDGPSEKYWELLAKKRQVALQEALEENKTLQELVDKLKEENAALKQMLEEANSFVEIVKQELADSANDDTGIDVNDVSTADETGEDSQKPSTPNSNNDDE